MSEPQADASAYTPPGALPLFVDAEDAALLAAVVDDPPTPTEALRALMRDHRLRAPRREAADDAVA